MENHLVQTEDKFLLFMKHAATGMAEIDGGGSIAHLNDRAKEIIHTFAADKGTSITNLFQLFPLSAAAIAERIKIFMQDEEPERLSASFIITNGEGNAERRIKLVISRLLTESFIVCFEEVSDKAVQQALLDKAVVQGKYEIASNVLHDVGNAVVGFSSYLTRIKRSLELDNADNLQNLVAFFETQRGPVAAAIGEAKADAIVKIISGIAQTQKTNRSDIQKSITEQQHIINHIQEILNIQRQYVGSAEAIEKKPVSLNSIVNDCMSMLFASFNKRNIIVATDIPEDLPFINGDRTKMMQVILNILKNSIEAIEVYAVDKSIAVSAEVTSTAVSLKIKDSGKGFDEETGKKLFTRGFTTKKSGTGLGLDHCRAILEGHGGSISITSDGPDKGATTIMQFIL